MSLEQDVAYWLMTPTCDEPKIEQAKCDTSRATGTAVQGLYLYALVSPVTVAIDCQWWQWRRCDSTGRSHHIRETQT